MKAFEHYYHQVFFSSEEELMDLTGCLLPCTYTHYSLLDSFPIVSNNSAFAIHYALTDMITEQEVLLFPFDSLVSEFGGALGLFLGFSFLGALSMMQIWIRTILSQWSQPTNMRLDLCQTRNDKNSEEMMLILPFRINQKYISKP